MLKRLESEVAVEIKAKIADSLKIKRYSCAKSASKENWANCLVSLRCSTANQTPIARIIVATSPSGENTGVSLSMLTFCVSSWFGHDLVYLNPTHEVATAPSDSFSLFQKALCVSAFSSPPDSMASHRAKPQSLRFAPNGRC